MSGRWANLALAVLLPLATLSGFGLFLVGNGPVWVVALLHGGLGLAPLALVPWKHPVVRRGLRRVGRAGRSLSVLLSWVAVIAVVSGLAHLVGLTAGRLPLTTMQVHVTAGLVATVLVVVHAVQRPVRARRTDLGRRALLRGAGLAGVTVAGGAAALGLGDVLDRDAARRTTGSVRLAADEPLPVTQWLFDTVPDVEPAAWRLTLVTGAGERQLATDELHGPDTVLAVLDCTGGWWSEQEWTGTRVRRLLPDAAPTDSVLVTSTTGYARRLPLSDDLLLATAMAGQPLPAGHGAPVRLVVPGRRGYHWVKWVVRVEVVAGPWWEQPPLPLR